MGGTLPPGGIADALDGPGDGDGLGRFNSVLLTAMMRAAQGWARHGGRDADALKQEMRAAILAAPRRPGRDVQRYLSDAYLYGIIRGAVALVATGDRDAQVSAPCSSSAARCRRRRPCARWR